MITQELSVFPSRPIEVERETPFAGKSISLAVGDGLITIFCHTWEEYELLRQFPKSRRYFYSGGPNGPIIHNHAAADEAWRTYFTANNRIMEAAE